MTDIEYRTFRTRDQIADAQAAARSLTSSPASGTQSPRTVPRS